MFEGEEYVTRLPAADMGVRESRPLLTKTGPERWVVSAAEIELNEEPKTFVGKKLIMRLHLNSTRVRRIGMPNMPQNELKCRTENEP